MKQRIKAWFCALLAAAALLCLTATLADLGVLKKPGSGRDEYLVRSSDGLVCVYRLPETTRPLFVTELSPETLPTARRAELALGIGARDYEELRRLLANLGS